MSIEAHLQLQQAFVPDLAAAAPLFGAATTVAAPVASAAAPTLQPEDIIGTDDRKQSPGTRDAPWRLVCHLVIQNTQGRFVTGTGWLAGPSTVITAGHNLLYARHGHAASRVWVVPGRAGQQAPHGTLVSAAFDTHPAWQQTGRADADVGVVWLPQPIGRTLGWFGYAVLSDAVLTGQRVRTSGYPDDKPLGTQWFADSAVHRAMPNLFAHGIDTWPGQSGSPVFGNDALGRPVSLGVHVYGNVHENLAVRISPSINAAIGGWWR